MNAVTVNDSELMKLLCDPGNYERKVNDLSALLKEINAKIGIVNTLKEAEKLKSQSEALMAEVKSLQKLSREEDEQSRSKNRLADQKVKESELDLAKRLAEGEKREKENLSKKQELDAQFDRLCRDSQKFDDEKQKYEESLQVNSKKLEGRVIAVSTILTEANEKLSHV